MKNQYNTTITACFIGYIVQAIVNNFVPLLFLTFGRTYGIPLSQITLLVTVNFAVQLTVDLLSAVMGEKLNYRMALVAANLLSASGLILLTILPGVMPSAFAGILLSVIVYAVGGGLLEVVVSPVVESCPSDNKEKAMSMLHSFYCWGHVGVVAVSTLFFFLFGTENWRILAFAWAVIPLCNAVMFAKVPIRPLLDDGREGMSVRRLFSQRIFIVLFIMMVCAGASEQAVSQWASAFAEQGLGIAKTMGDLSGPMLFAVMMGLSRTFYGRYGDRINLDRYMTLSCAMCIASYLAISLVPIPQISLAGCALCGLSVGIMWPGTFSKASATLRRGGTAMFALLALGGDVGCSLGPTVVGMVSGSMNDNLRAGILAGIIFPVLLTAGIVICMKTRHTEDAAE